MWSSFLDWALRSEGSTRSAALIRIGLVLLVWSRWAMNVAPFAEPHPLKPLLAAVLYVTTGLMFVGLWTRYSAAAVAAVTAAMYVYGITHPFSSAWRSHHTYLLTIAIVYCALTPCGRSYSVDRWLAVRNARRAARPLPAERGNLLGLRLLTLQVAVVYFFAAFDKTHWGYLSGSRIEQILMNFYCGSTYPAWPGFHEVCVALGALTVVLEYALAFGLFFRGPRKLLLPLGVLFHVILYFALPVLTFSMTMILLYLAYLDPDEVHRVLDDVQSPA